MQELEEALAGARYKRSTKVDQISKLIINKIFLLSHTSLSSKVTVFLDLVVNALILN